MNSKLTNKIINIKNKYYFVYSAILTALFSYLTFSLAGMLRSGMYIMLRGDLLETHVPYIVMFCRNFLQGNSIWYSFDISMGMNSSLALAYYAVNPFNILFLIFNKADYNVIVAIIMILKMSFAAAFFQIFASKVLKLTDFKSVIISICYAFCGFMAAYGSYHIMWIDSFMILPLLCYFLVRAFKTNNYLLVILCYSYLFITQFYMGYMVGIYSFLFVIGYLYLTYKKDFNLKQTFSKLGCWILSVILGVIVSSIIWLPALLFLINNNPEDATQFMSFKMTFMEIVNSLFWGQFVDNVGRHSFTYCGIPVLILVPFYFFNNKITKKERIVAGLITLFLATSYVYMPLYKIMHAMDAPDSFWFRFSFLLSFTLCSIACRELVHIENISFKQIFSYVVGLIMFYCLEMRVQSLEHINFQQDSPLNLIINIIFICAWVGILYLIVRNINNNIILAVVLSILLIGIEVISNMYISLYAKSKEDTYYNWERQCNYAVNAIKNNEGNSNEFYRVVINNDMIHNSDSLFGYNGISDFGSSENYYLRKTLSNMGYGTTTRMSMSSGYNPISNMLLGVKYIVQCYGNDERVILDSNNSRNSEILPDISMYETTLNVGYMVNDEILDYSFPGRNDFENLNSLLSTMTGKDINSFVKIPKENIKYTYENSILYQLEDDKDGKYYISFTGDEGIITVNVLNDDYEAAFVQFEVDDALATENDIWYSGGINTVNGFDSLLNVSSIINLDYNEDSDSFYYYICKDENTLSEAVFNDINYYSYNYDEQLEGFYDLSEEQLYVDKYKNGYILGHISIESNRRVMFTSIPYDSGWTVTANDQEVETVSVLDGAFMAIVLPDAGDYVIEMNYKTPGVDIGRYASGFGGIVVLLYGLLLYNKNKKKISIEDCNANEEVESANVDDSTVYASNEVDNDY